MNLKTVEWKTIFISNYDFEWSKQETHKLTSLHRPISLIYYFTYFTYLADSKALGKLFAFKEHQLCIILTLSSSFSTVLWWSLYFSCLGSRIKKSLFLFISEHGIESLKQETRILEQENPTLESGVSFMFVRKKFHHGVTFSWKIPSLKKTQDFFTKVFPQWVFWEKIKN